MGGQRPCFVHPFGGQRMYCIAILLCLQPLSGQNKDDAHLYLRRTKIPDIPKRPVLRSVNLEPSVLLPAESEKKTHSCHVMRTHALILTDMGVFSLRTKAATIGWGHLNGQKDRQRPTYSQYICHCLYHIFTML